MDWPSMSPDLNAVEHLWGILKLKVEERKVSNIHQLHDVVTKEWKRAPVTTCEDLVNSMPKRVKAVQENNGGHMDSLYQYKTRPLTGDWLQVCFGTRSDTAVKSVFRSADSTKQAVTCY